MDEKRIERLLEYTKGLREERDSRQLYLSYREDIESVTPFEVMELENRQLTDGVPVNMVLDYADKLINVFYKSLSAYVWEKPEPGSFLHYLIKENESLKNKLSEIKDVIKKQDYHKSRKQLTDLIRQVQLFEAHYEKKENILFPYLEKKSQSYYGLKVMWELHHRIRQNLKNILTLLEKQEIDIREFNVSIGKLIFQISGLIQKEQLILFPIATMLFNESEMSEMLEQSLSYDFPFIDKPGKNHNEEAVIKKEDSQAFFNSNGGLNNDQLLLVLSYLPVDMTLIDENDKVVFFNDSKERIFKRSKAVIGRDVKNCHPPKSIHMVEKILSAFRNGEKDKAEFWIVLHGKTVLITYYAIRNEEHEYKGTLEVTQDVTDIKKIEGEKRLLDW